MKEENGFDRSLDEQQQMIAPANMGQLVQQNGFQLLGRQLSGNRRGQKDRRLHHADNNRAVDDVTVVIEDNPASNTVERLLFVTDRCQVVTYSCPVGADRFDGPS